MARTYQKKGMYPTVPSNSYMSLIERDNLLEGASQTFPIGAPLSYSSGLLVVFVAPTTAKIAAFALEAGHNTTGSTVHGCLATPEVEIEGNLLTSSAADYVLLATDNGRALDLASNANLEGTSLPGWYIQATTSDPSVTVCNFYCDQQDPKLPAAYPTAGDTNARIRARVTSGKSVWY